MPMPQLPPQLLQALIELLTKGQGGGADPQSALREGELGEGASPMAPMTPPMPGATEAGPAGPLMDPSSVVREGELGGGGDEVTMPPALLEIMRRLKLRPSV
jgi:hypothetical protein